MQNLMQYYVSHKQPVLTQALSAIPRELLAATPNTAQKQCATPDLTLCSMYTDVRNIFTSGT